MQLSEVRRLLACDVFWGEEFLDRAIKYGCASDLMSDVLAFSRADALLLTGLVNIQTIQTAFIAEIGAIVFVRGKKPDEAVLKVAREKKIPLLGTPHSMYEASGILYQHGVVSTMECSSGVGCARGN
jgi:predicted transcriptional regulator